MNSSDKTESVIVNKLNDTSKQFSTNSENTGNENIVNSLTGSLEDSWQTQFENKLFICLVIWFLITLILIRIFWKIYGCRITNTFIKTDEQPTKNDKNSKTNYHHHTD